MWIGVNRQGGWDRVGGQKVFYWCGFWRFKYCEMRAKKWRKSGYFLHKVALSLHRFGLFLHGTAPFLHKIAWFLHGFSLFCSDFGHFSGFWGDFWWFLSIFVDGGNLCDGLFLQNEMREIITEMEILWWFFLFPLRNPMISEKVQYIFSSDGDFRDDFVNFSLKNRVWKFFWVKNNEISSGKINFDKKSVIEN